MNNNVDAAIDSASLWRHDTAAKWHGTVIPHLPSSLTLIVYSDSAMWVLSYAWQIAFIHQCSFHLITFSNTQILMPTAALLSPVTFSFRDTTPKHCDTNLLPICHLPTCKLLSIWVRRCFVLGRDGEGTMSSMFYRMDFSGSSTINRIFFV